jgi:hypothetical protein
MKTFPAKAGVKSKKGVMRMKTFKKSDIKRGDWFTTKRNPTSRWCTASNKKKEKIRLWTIDDIGCVEIEYTMREIYKYFTKDN